MKKPVMNGDYLGLHGYGWAYKEMARPRGEWQDLNENG